MFSIHCGQIKLCAQSPINDPWSSEVAEIPFGAVYRLYNLLFHLGWVTKFRFKIFVLFVRCLFHTSSNTIILTIETCGEEFNISLPIK